jgi:hypothetical protein
VLLWGDEESWGRGPPGVRCGEILEVIAHLHIHAEVLTFPNILVHRVYFQ